MKRKVVLFFALTHLCLVFFSNATEKSEDFLWARLKDYRKITSLGGNWFFFHNGMTIRWKIVDTQPKIVPLMLVRAPTSLTAVKINRYLSLQMYAFLENQDEKVFPLKWLCKKYPKLEKVKIGISDYTVKSLKIIEKDFPMVYEGESLAKYSKFGVKEFVCES